MSPLPIPVQHAISTLIEMQAALGQINANGNGAYGVIPGDVTIPTPSATNLSTGRAYAKVQVGTQGSFHQPVYKNLTFTIWPRAQYQQWQSAWAILMGYTGWWGSKSNWPLGDGERAESDANTAANLPPAVAAMTTLQTTLTVVQAPTWVPDVQWTAIGAVGLFIVGGVLAWFNARHVIEGQFSGMQPKQRSATLLGWNLGRALYHVARSRR